MIHLISPYRIKFRGKTNIDFDVIVGAAFDSDHGNTESFLVKESTSSNTYDGSRRNIHGYHYTDVMNVSFTLIKQDYTDITDLERRKIYSWLTGSNKVEELIIYKDDSEEVAYRLMGNFTSIEHYKLGNGRDVGVIVNFEHIAPYAYSLTKTITRTITQPEAITINCRSDAYEKPLYPRITITIGDSIFLPVYEDPSAPTFEMLENVAYKYLKLVDGNYKAYYYIKINGQKHALRVTPSRIENQATDSQIVGAYCLSTYDNTVYLGVKLVNSYSWQKVVAVGAGFEVSNTYYENGKNVTTKSIITECFTHEEITLDGDNKIISSTRTPMRIFGESFNWDWIHFIPGENQLAVSGDCTIKIEWVEPVKIGNM